MRLKLLALALLATPLTAQIPAPQLGLTGNIGCQGFPCVNSGTLIYSADADHVMTAQESSAFYIKITSSVSLTVTRKLISPSGKFPFTIENATTGGQSIQIIGPSGTGITIPNGQTISVWFDGTNYIETGASQIYPAAGIPNSTGSSWSASYSTTGSGNVVLSTSPTLVTPALGTPSSGNLANTTGYLYANLSGAVPTWNQNTTGTAANITATSNSTLTTLSALSLPETQVTGLGALATAPYPAAGIPNSTGSAWGSSYSTSGSGSVALTNSPTFNSATLNGTITVGSYSEILSNLWAIGFPVSTDQVWITNQTVAISGTNQSSPILELLGNFWDGSASQSDGWQLQDVLGTGTNPSSTLTFTHTSAGTPSSTAVSIPNATLTGTPTAPTAAVGTNTTQIATTANVFTSLPVRTSCGTGTTCTVTTLTQPLKDAYGAVVLAGGTATVTGIPAFTSTTTAQCSCEDTSSPLQACSASLASTTSVTVTGNGTDTDKWHCFGN